MSEVTLLLAGVTRGDKAALDRLVPLVYKELREIASGHLRRERPGHTLQPTALVHEAYTRMLGQDQPDYRDLAHFLCVAAQVMRRILIDHSRSRNASKRGGGDSIVPFDEVRNPGAERPTLYLELDDALIALEQRDPLKARLVEMHYFGGLTAAESARVLSLETSLVQRELRIARAWLHRTLRSPSARTYN